jgi:MATE family multidrug resistance protein
LGTTSLAANPLSLASLTFMFAMGLSVAVTIRVGTERTYGLCEIAACGAIHILLAILETVFAVISFHQYLPQFFVNVNDMTCSRDQGSD